MIRFWRAWVAFVVIAGVEAWVWLARRVEGIGPDVLHSSDGGGDDA